MESAEWEWEHTNDSWIRDVPDPQNGIENEWEWGDSNDSWDLQYGEKKRKADDDEVSTPEKFYTINEVRK